MSRFRRILPSSSTQSSSGVDPASITPLEKRRRPKVGAACEPCRAKKIACDTRRPSCTPCLRRGTTCTVKRLDTEELMYRLRNLPEDDAVDLLRRLRAADDPAAFLSSLRGTAHSTYRPSDLTTAMRMGPPVQTCTEIELMIQHSTAYLKIIPVGSSFLEQLVQMSAAPSQSLPHPGAISSHDRIARASIRTHENPQLQPQLHEAPSQSPPLRPLNRTLPSALPRGKYCDERLQQLQMDRWTCVPVENEFAAAVLSNYLENDHLVTGFFDADIVLDDLTASHPQFCTSFFFSSLMFLACQSYTVVDIRAASIGLCFFKEAEMLCPWEAAVDSLSTVSGLAILSTATAFQGKDSRAQEFLDLAHGMAVRLYLFDVLATNPEALSLRSKPAVWRKAASSTAWGVFNYIALFNGFYPREPIHYPPTLPMPGRPAGKDSDQPVTTVPSQPPPRHTSPFFHVQCQLWVVSQEIASVYKRQSGIAIRARVPLAFVEGKYRRLLDCMEQMEGNIVQRDDSPAHAVILHINFHVIVLNAFQPFIKAPNSSGDRLWSFTSSDCNPRTIYAASVNQLKQLTLWSHIRYGKFISIFYNAASLVLVSALLRDDVYMGPEQRLYFLLCIRCCADLEVSYPIFVDLTQAFLYMAVQRGAISIEEASSLIKHVRHRGSHHSGVEEAVLNCYSDQDLAEPAPDQATTHAMALLFEDLSLFDKYTTGQDFVPDR